MNYSDTAGTYYGEISLGIPHGKGIKVYADNLIYEGEWKQGRKQGKGTIKASNQIFELLWNEGLPIKITRITNLNNKYSCTNILELNIFPILYEEHYAEICDNENPKKYYFYLNTNNYIVFEGELFTTPLKDVNNLISENFSYTGETKDQNPFGYAHIITEYFYYIGFNNCLTLTGQGTKVYGNGTVYKGLFDDDFLNGEGEIINKEASILGTFCENKPVGEVLFTFNGEMHHLFISWIYGTLNIRCNFDIKDTLKEIIRCIEFMMMIYYDVHLKYINGKIFQKFYRNKPKLLKDKRKNYNFKDFKSWKDYESENLKKSISLLKLIKEDNGVYSGEMANGIKNGKGKMIFTNNKIYTGEWKNGKIEGYGKLCYRNGDYYIGCFTNGMRNGFGKFISAELCYFGYWKDDKFNGQGRLKFPCKEISGTFCNGDLNIGLYPEYN